MRIIRWLLGTLILFFDWLFTPKGIVREELLQTTINEQTGKLALYQYKACPFCVKVRRAMKRLSLPIQTRDTKCCEHSRQELLSGGGTLKVPCLKIEDNDGNIRWMYESSDIIQYLESRFAQQQA